MLDTWKQLLFPALSLFAPQAHFMLWWAAGLLAGLCVLLSWMLFQDGKGRGNRPTRQSSRNEEKVWDTLFMAVAIFAGWLLLTFLTLATVRFFRGDISFDKIFGVVVFGSLPKFLTWAAYPLRNRSHRVYRLWQAFTVLMLVWMSASVWTGLDVVCRLLWWQTCLVAFPSVFIFWAIGISEVKELPKTFRAAYQWQRTEGAKVILYTPGGKAQSELAEIASGSDDTLERVCALMEVTSLSFKPEVFLFPDKETHQKVTGYERMTADGYAHYDCLSSVYKEWKSLHSLIAHELTHVVCDQSITRHLLPVLEEGLACYVQHRVTPGIRSPAILLPTSLAALAQRVVFHDWLSTDEPEYPPLQKYAHAHALVEYLVHWHGLDKFKQLCVEAAKNPAADAGERLAKATKTVYGMSLRDVETHWRGNWDVVARSVNAKPDKAFSWERFTEKARAAVWAAQEEAEALGQDTTATEHLLLGLIRDEQSRACILLQKAGANLSALREMLVRDAPRGLALGGEKTFAADSKRVFDLAFDEARQHNCNYIGTEHLLMGLLRDDKGAAGRTLIHFGVEPAAIRHFLG